MAAVFERDLPRVATSGTIERARSGDDEAVSELWSIYQPQLLRLLRSQRAVAPDDVASQVWLEVSSRLGRFEGDGDAFRAWVFTLARRRLIDEARRVRRRREVSPDDSPSDDPATEPTVASLIDHRDERICDVIAQLQPTAAEAVTLRVVHDMPFAEIARITGGTEGSVRTLVHRSLARLRASVDSADDDPGLAD